MVRHSSDDDRTPSEKLSDRRDAENVRDLTYSTSSAGGSGSLSADRLKSAGWSVATIRRKD